MLTEERSSKVEDLVRWRQHDLTIVLENIHDPHNLGAIVRTCDAAGIGKIHVIYSEEGENSKLKYIGKRASRGAAKWVDVLFYKDVASCISVLRNDGFQLYATHLGEKSETVYNINLNQSCAIVFGNEKDGISRELLNLCDGNLIIPMFGMVQSLNVSNAVAVILFEAVRQRELAGNFSRVLNPEDPKMMSTIRDYMARTRPSIAKRNFGVIDIFVDGLMKGKNQK